MESSAKGFEVEAVFSVGSILSRSFSILMQNPGVYLGLALVAAIPTAIIEVMSINSDSAGNPSGFIDFVLGLIIQGAIAYAVFNNLLGKTVSIGDALSNGMSRIGTLILLGILTAVCIFVGLLALIVPGIILACMWAVVVQACVIEELVVVDSLKRSAELTKGYRLQIFGLFVLVGLAMFLLLFIVGIFIGVSVIDEAQIGILGTLALSLITVPVVAYNSVMTAIIYADLRAVKEGVTINHLVNVFD